MMGLAIAHQIRDQVVFTQRPINVMPSYNFNREKPMQRDKGSRITVV
jgi:hypothetical protein